MKVLLGGGGITSSLIGYFLRNFKERISLDLWEKHEELGGRMKTLHNVQTNVPVDLGAQYITTNAEFSELYSEVYNSLFQNNKIQELDCIIKNMKPISKGTINYIAPEGMSSLVTHFLKNNFNEINLCHCITTLNVFGNTIEVEANNKVKNVYDAIILTMPVPDILRLTGNFKNFISNDIHENMKNVKYSSRFVLVLIYDKQLEVDWDANYITDNIFRYISIQEKKIKLPSNQSSVIFHTSVEFGKKYFHCNNDEIELILLKHVYELFPEWINPIKTFCYKWEYSQITSPFHNSPKCVVLCSKPIIIMAGDSFTCSSFNGCITSAKATADIILQNFSM
ncbi:hypothetical protein PGB90_005538 [Kerria lacca]